MYPDGCGSSVACSKILATKVILSCIFFNLGDTSCVIGNIFSVKFCFFCRTVRVMHSLSNFIHHMVPLALPWTARTLTIELHT